MAYKRPEPTSRKVVIGWCVGAALVLVLMCFGLLQLTKAPKPAVPSKKAEDKKEVVETPKVEPKALPKVETPKVEPKALPKVETPKVEPKALPKVETPKVEPKALPKVETPKVEPKALPKVETPKEEPKADTKAPGEYLEVYRKRIKGGELKLEKGKITTTPFVELVRVQRYGSGRIMFMFAITENGQEVNFEGCAGKGQFQPMDFKSRTFTLDGRAQKETFARIGLVKIELDVGVE